MRHSAQQDSAALLHHRGYLSVVLAAALWAASGTASKFLFQTGMTPFQLVQIRTTLATVALAFWFFMRDRRLLSIERRDIGNFLLLGITLAAAQFTYLFAISRVQVAAAILLQYMSPVLIALYAATAGREKQGILTWAVVAGAVSGCYLMVGGYDLDMLSMNREGVLSGLLSAATFAVYTVRSEKGMRRYSPWTVVFYSFLFAAVCWNIAHPPLEAFLHEYSAERWLIILGIGIFGTVLPFGLYNMGIHSVSSTHASVTATLEPVIAGIIAFIALGETMTLLQMLGGGIVIVLIVVLQYGVGLRSETR